MILSRTSRRALSLTEVLIAIFVMAIGMISLLVLFIVGLQNARWGLDNGRLAMMASNGNAVSESAHTNVETGAGVPVVRVDTSYSLRTDQASNLASIKSIWTPLPVGTLPLMTPLLGRNYFLMTDPTTWAGSTKWTFATNLNAIAGVPTGAALVYPPVMIDPIVVSNLLWINAVTGLPFHVGATSPQINPYLPFTFENLPQVASTAPLRPLFGGATATLGLPRSTLVYYPTNPLGVNSDTTLPDEINFADKAQPFPASPGPYQNDRRFSVSYLCRWPDLTKPEICDVTQVLYTGRPNGGGVMSTPPGEVNYRSNIATSTAGMGDLLGRFFVKGNTTAVVWLENGLPMAAKAGDWILDNTFILPEYNETAAYITYKAPFLDTYVPNPLTINGANGPLQLRAGLAGGYFYKVVGITDVQTDPVSGLQYQVLTLDRPARSDGFVGTMITGVADVIEKGVGRMPAR